MRVLLLAALSCSLYAADPTRTLFEGMPGWLLSNGAADMVILEQGASIAKITIAADKDSVNPLWDPLRVNREAGRRPRPTGSTGHFLCLDAFGAPSAEERAAGLEFHGEAVRSTMKVKSFEREGTKTTLTLETPLPLVQEHLTRQIEVVDGESLFYVRTRVESKVAFDRPMIWAEHATVGSPFLEPGITVVDMPATKGKTRAYTQQQAQNRRLHSDKEFAWPMAPMLGGGAVELRAVPSTMNSTDHSTAVMDRSRKYAFVTALHPRKRLLVGWVFKTEEFPWVQSWENYRGAADLARGLEFSTQPFDVPRRESVNLNSMLGAPTFRWLPAKSTVEGSFIMFYTQAPEGMEKVDDVTLENGRLVIVDKKNGKQISLAASLPL